jgi:hypothetical protein
LFKSVLCENCGFLLSGPRFFENTTGHLSTRMNTCRHQNFQIANLNNFYWSHFVDTI